MIRATKFTRIAASLSNFESEKIGREWLDKQSLQNELHMTIKHFGNLKSPSKNTSKSE